MIFSHLFHFFLVTLNKIQTHARGGNFNQFIPHLPRNVFFQKLMDFYPVREWLVLGGKREAQDTMDLKYGGGWRSKVSIFSNMCSSIWQRKREGSMGKAAIFRNEVWKIEKKVKGQRDNFEIKHNCFGGVWW